MNKLSDVCSINEIRSKINELVVNTSVVDIGNGSISSISSKENGWYKWTGNLLDVSGTWIITKMGTFYTANNIEDPRVVLNSANLTNWYSPYASWHT